MGGPFHIRVERKEDIAERVVVAGDPARVKFLKKFLEEPRLVSRIREYYVYTGNYRGVPVSLAVHGVGSGSAALILEELVMLGARVIVRLGTCGAMVGGLEVGDVVIPHCASYYLGGIFHQYLGEPVCLAAAPDFQLLESLVSEIRAAGIRHVVAPIVSCDAFYTEKGFVDKWLRRGAVAVDMETAILYSLGFLKRVRVVSALLVSNSLVKQTGFLLAGELEESVRRVAEPVLRTIIKTPLNLNSL
ncbi:MAG: nucleoside phosphorylase [Nitrososphaerota archaeon]